MSEIYTGIRDSLGGLEQLVREAGEDAVGDQIRQIIQSPNQITALQEIFSKFFQRKKRPNESQNERHNFFTNFSSTERTLSPKQINELVLITKDWEIDNKRVCILRAFVRLWQAHPALFWHGAPDSNATRRCIENLEHIRQTDSSKRKALLVLLSEDVSLEQKRMCTCPDRTHKQTNEDLKSARASHLRLAIKSLCQNLYPDISEQQKRAKKAWITLDSLCGWKWNLLKNVALVLSLTRANIKRYELRDWQPSEANAINAYVRTLPQFNILDDLERAWESIVTFYRGSYQQRIHASDRLLVPINAQDLHPMGPQLNNQSPLPAGISQILEIPLIDVPQNRKRKKYRSKASSKRQCVQKSVASDIGPCSELQDGLAGVHLSNKELPSRTPLANNEGFQTTIFDTSACENIGNDIHRNNSHAEPLVATLAALHETSPQLWSTPPQDALPNMDDIDDPESLINTIEYLQDRSGQVTNISSEQERLALEDPRYNPESLVSTVGFLHSIPTQLHSVPEDAAVSPTALIEASRTFLKV